MRNRAGLRIMDTIGMPGKIFVMIGQESYFFPVDVPGEILHVPIASEDRTMHVEVLSSTPRLVLIKNFLSDEECDMIIEVCCQVRAPMQVPYFQLIFQMRHSSASIHCANPQATD